MKLDIISIIKDIGASIAFSRSEWLEELKSGIGAVEFTSPVEFSGKVTGLGGMVMLEGEAKVDYKTVCDRCGESLERTLRIPVREDIVEIKENDADDDQESPDDRFSFTGHTVELDQILNDAILLNLPMHHLCREDCAGAGFPNDEEDAEQAQSVESDKPIDPRFESLKGYFKE